MKSAKEPTMYNDCDVVLSNVKSVQAIFRRTVLDHGMVKNTTGLRVMATAVDTLISSLDELIKETKPKPQATEPDLPPALIEIITSKEEPNKWMVIAASAILRADTRLMSHPDVGAWAFKHHKAIFQHSIDTLILE